MKFPYPVIKVPSGTFVVRKSNIKPTVIQLADADKSRKWLEATIASAKAGLDPSVLGNKRVDHPVPCYLKAVVCFLEGLKTSTSVNTEDVFLELKKRQRNFSEMGFKAAVKTLFRA